MHFYFLCFLAFFGVPGALAVKKWGFYMAFFDKSSILTN
jgi:hypothetical protein